MSYRAQIPPIYCPIPSAIHPRWKDVESRTMSWLAGYGFGVDEHQRAYLAATKSSEWCCRIAADGIERLLEIFVGWTYIAFMFDDVYDSGRRSRPISDLLATAGEWLGALSSPEAPPAKDNRYASALHDLGLRVRAEAPGELTQRLISAHFEWFLGMTFMMGHRLDGTTPTLDSYVHMAPRDRATKLAVTLIEIAEGTLLGGSELASPPVRAISEAADLIVTCDNDLFSYQREAAHEALESNMVNTLAHEHRCSLEEAILRTVALRDRVMCLFLKLRDQIGQHASAALRRYLTQLGHLIRGNLDWSLTVPRYYTEVDGEPVPSLDSYQWADRPSDGSLDPLPVPSIAWWWDQLT